jgi:hypothetical protein
VRYDRDEGLLYLTDDTFIHAINDWPQVFTKGWNWITFRFLLLSFENDYMIPGWEIEAAVLGLGFRLRVNRDIESTEQGREIKRRMEAVKDGTAELIPLDEAFKEDRVDKT